MTAENSVPAPKKQNTKKIIWLIPIGIVAITIIIAVVLLLPKENTEDESQNNNIDSRNSDIVDTFTPDSKAAFQYNPPTITDNYIFIGTSSKVSPEGDPAAIIAGIPDNYFYKLDLDFNIIWQYNLNKTMVDGAAVLDSEGNIYFTTIAFSPATGSDKKLFTTEINLSSLDSSGNFRWKYKISADEEDWDHGMVNVAIGADDTIYVGDKKLYAFNPDGTIKWQYPAGEEFIVGNRSAPSLDNAGSVYFVSPEPSTTSSGSDQLNVYKFEYGSTTPKWVSKLPKVQIDPQEGGGTTVSSTYGAPVFNGDFSKVIVTAANTVYSLDALTGTISWSYKPEGVKGLFKAGAVLDKDGNVYVGSKANQDSAFYAIKGDGTGLLWKIDINADVYPSALIGDDNRVYFGSEGSDLYGHFHSADLTTGQLTWNTGFGKAPMVDLSFGSPALYNGYIYVGAFQVNEQDGGSQALYKIKVLANNYQQDAMWPRFRGGNDSNGRKGIVPPYRGSTLEIIAPYVYESDVSSINEAYSMDANNPYWGFVHPGVDFMITKPFIPVVASTSGTIVNLEIKKENGIMGWHAGFAIEYNKEFSVCYNLETFASDSTTEQRLRDNVFIKTGDYVEQGELIANLIYGGSGAHIDFGVCTAGTRVCPESYFTPSARESVIRLIHIKQPTWPMCD